MKMFARSKITDSNAELIFQNGMIISITLMAVSIAGSIGETIAFVRYQKKITGRDISTEYLALMSGLITNDEFELITLTIK